MDLASEGKIDVKSLITHRFSLEEIRRALETTRKKDENVMISLIIP